MVQQSFWLVRTERMLTEHASQMSKVINGIVGIDTRPVHNRQVWVMALTMATRETARLPSTSYAALFDLDCNARFHYANSASSPALRSARLCLRAHCLRASVASMLTLSQALQYAWRQGAFDLNHAGYPITVVRKSKKFYQGFYQGEGHPQ
jgi:hypothetical protein